MDAWQQAWHWVNLLLLPGTLAAIHASICKLVWRRELARVSWLRLALCCAGAALAVDVAGWAWTGHEGAMLTYGAMVVALALTTWWMAFAPRRRRAST